MNDTTERPERDRDNALNMAEDFYRRVSNAIDTTHKGNSRRAVLDAIYRDVSEPLCVAAGLVMMRYAVKRTLDRLTVEFPAEASDGQKIGEALVDDIRAGRSG